MIELFETLPSVSAAQAYKSTFSAIQSSSIPLCSSVTCPIEVSFSDEHQTELAYFLRLLKQANNENRWIMFIGHDAVLDKKLLESAKIDLSKVLVLHKTKSKSLPKLMEMALQSGNCSAVISSGEISEYQTNAIREAAQAGKSLAFVISKEQAKSRITLH
ncbi:cell division protein FtsZ [Photobacterium jeanii]|uniref:Cell division protein FtsZ n=1 Tax=Photobacterium jeanii TaxID=858640 RepID=A0A178KL15_9GAMM|nr:SulA-like leucine-rich domain-containing protein [Photobacterium jeanii]OAN18019.1 cell division protein FtsZ [Photobacterium jeanii]PST92312.1 cell division protein FtsZ [Photobacterium jeanii]